MENIVEQGRPGKWFLKKWNFPFGNDTKFKQNGKEHAFMLEGNATISRSSTGHH